MDTYSYLTVLLNRPVSRDPSNLGFASSSCCLCQAHVRTHTQVNGECRRPCERACVPARLWNAFSTGARSSRASLASARCSDCLCAISCASTLLRGIWFCVCVRVCVKKWNHCLSNTQTNTRASAVRACSSMQRRQRGSGTLCARRRRIVAVGGNVKTLAE